MASPGGSIAWLVFTASIPILMEHWYTRDKAEDRLFADNEMEAGFALPANETYDFIIVGAGSAGCVLAHRLSEHFSVLVLEAGGEPPPVESNPNLSVTMKYLSSKFHWFLKSTPQQYASLQNGGMVQTSAGKMLGGSGSHNGAHYERGSPYDYDNWANWTGDDSWRYSNVLKYFLKSENYKGRYNTANGQHGTEGLIDVAASEVPFRDDLFFNAGRELGYEVGLDPNGPQRIGFAAAEYNIRRGIRVSSYFAYLKPIVGIRRNLVVHKYAVVSEVIIDSLRATGVRYLRHGVPRVAFASKEVILSAGAFVSPMILMRSGVGPKEQLDLLRTPQLLDLPVGQKFQTHVLLDVGINVTDTSVFKYSQNNVTFADFEEFKTLGTGFLACREASHEAHLVSSSSAASGHPEWSDLHLFFRQVYRNVNDVLSCAISLSRPRSIGRLLVNSSATTLEESLTPILDLNLFGDESDYDAIIDGIRVCQNIATTSTFQRIGAEVMDSSVPECGCYDSDSRDYWICVIRLRATITVHASSTVSMGARNDPTAVLDSSLRVRGIRSLRVVDSSIMPFITNANINAAVIMIAEKASEAILQTYGIKLT